ncbi:MAG: DUF2092 domain-containing protein, partial [Burkholderiales bacterium]
MQLTCLIFPRLKRSSRAMLLPAILALCTAAGSAYAQDEPPADQPDAEAILLGMADYLSKAQSFSVDVHDSYDTYQESGQKIEYSESRTIIVVRPDRLRIDVLESDGEEQSIIYDGKQIMVSNPLANVYGASPAPGTTDEAVVYFVQKLHMRMPFAPLLLTTAPAELQKRTTTLDYVEETSIHGAKAHHLAGRTAAVDYQVWIEDGDRPLLQRLVLTYPNEPGEPQFRAQFSNWNLAPQSSDTMFATTPPPGATRIAFLAELPSSVAPSQEIPAPAGDTDADGGQK